MKLLIGFTNREKLAFIPKDCTVQYTIFQSGFLSSPSYYKDYGKIQL